MPLFKVESPGYQRCLIKAENIADIIEKALKKWGLAEDGTYKVFFNFIF